MTKRYTIPFVSRNGTQCRIDIYDAQYTGAAVTLSTTNPSAPAVPATSPIVIEENDSTSMLEVIRAKTGYITLIELQTGALNTLYPLTNTQCQVYLYYDTELVFFGYIQAQTFRNDYKSAPRTMSFPIVSPLGLMTNRIFGEDPNLNDTMLGYYLDECLIDYDDIILPRDLIATPDEGVNTPLQIKLNTRTVCPWNTEYDYGLQSDGTTPSPYAPISWADLLRGFCNLYGLVVHDYGKTVIFSRYDYNEQYVRMTVSDLSEDTMETTGLPRGDAQLSIDTYFSHAGADGIEEVVMPLGKLTYDYGSAVDTVSMDLSRSKYVIRVNIPRYEDFSTLAVLNPQTREFSSQYLNTEGGTQDNRNHVRILGDGDNEMVEIRVVIPADSSRDTELFSYTFTNIPANISGAIIDSTFTHEEGQTAQKLRMQIISGGKYYNTDHNWVTTPTFLPLTFDTNGNCTTYDVASNGRTITMKIFPPSTNDGSGSVVGIIKSVTLETFADPLRRYEIPTDTEKIVRNSTPSKEEATIDMLMNMLGCSPNRIVGGYINRCAYLYLFESQQRQQRTMLMKQSTSIPLLYLYKLTTTGSSLKWRLVAINFNPWNDEYLLTIHGSSTI